MTPARLLLLRHGRTAWNADRRFQGQSDPPLDVLGRRQARAAAALLAGETPDLIVSSDLARAVQTAAPLGARTGLAVQLDRRLREISLGHWEGKTRAEVELAFPDELADWTAGRTVRRGGGELQSEVAERAVQVVTELDAETVVLVTHGGTAKSLTGRLLGLSEHQWQAIAPLANSQWSELRREGAGWRLQRHNVGALPEPAASTTAVDAEEPDEVSTGS